MKKRLLLPIVIALTLIITLSAMAIAVSATSGTPELTVVAANLSFEENVHLLYVVDFENIDKPEEINLLVFRGDDVTQNICTLENADKILTPTDTVDEDGIRGLVYEYSALVAAEMTEDVYVRAYIKQGEQAVYSPVVKYSILQYACNMLGVTGTATENAKLANMLEKMLEYGAAAQEVFEVNLDRLATDDYVRVNFDGATLKDGLSYGLLKVGEKVEVYAPTDETNKYALWTDANGNAVGNGGTIEYTATKNANVTAETMDYEPSFGAYDRVIIIGVDGAGSFYPDNVNENSTRIQNKIFGNGSVTRTMRVGTPTASCVGWSAVLHGVKPENIGFVENIVPESASTYPVDSKYPSILKLVKDAYPEADVAALYNWIGIHGLVEQSYGIDTLQLSNDADLTAYITDTYLAQNAPKMMFVHLGNPDTVGHIDGHHTDAYYSAIDTAYTQIEKIYDVIKEQDAANGTSTLFIVTTDHGGINLGHGGLTDYEKYGMFAVAGKTVLNGAAEDMQIRDAASVALYALGLAQPDTYTSAIPAGIFEGVDAGTRKEYHDPDNPRYHLPEQTPAAGNSNYITNVVNNKLLAYLPFDGATTDVYGREVKEFGKITYEDGYFGQGINLDEGHVNIMNFAPGNDSFTLAFWMKTPSPHVSSPIITNKESDTGAQGFILLAERTGPDYLKFRYNFGNGIVSATEDVDLPEDYFCGWMHVTLVFDRVNETMTLCYDFGEMYTIPIHSDYGTMEGVSMTTIYNYLVLGNDTTGEITERKSGLSIDEFMYFDGAFTRNDINDLSEYFNREPVVADEKNVTDVFGDDKQPDLYFDFNGNVSNKGEANVDITQVGTIPYVEGVDGEAAYFDGENYLTIDNFDLGANSYSFSFWLQPMDMVTADAKQDTTGWIRYCVPIFSNSDDISRSNLGLSIMLNNENDRIVVTMGDGSGNGFNNSYNLPSADYEKKWTHITINVERLADKGTVSVYFNFKEIMPIEANGKNIVYYNTSNPFLNSIDNPNNPFNIGQFGNPAINDNLKRTLIANIDDLMVFKRTLSNAELKAIRDFYTNPVSDYVTNAPEINLGFDGDLTNEGSYNGDIVNGGISYIENGRLDNSATFTGTAVELSDLTLDDKQSFAFAFWVKADDLETRFTADNFYKMRIFSTQAAGIEESVGFSINLDRDYKTIFVGTGASYPDDNGKYSATNRAYCAASWEGILNVNEWMHVVVVIRRAPNLENGEYYVEFYLNFEKVAVSTYKFNEQATRFAQNEFDAEGRTPHIGQAGDGAFAYTYVEELDDFMFFDSALTAEDVAGLKAYYAQFN